jgi:hypothetical protein
MCYRYAPREAIALTLRCRLCAPVIPQPDRAGRSVERAVLVHALHKAAGRVTRRRELLSASAPATLPQFHLQVLTFGFFNLGQHIPY